MTKKDYIKIARVFRKHFDNMEEAGKEEHQRFTDLLIEFAKMFSKDNSNFDDKKFYKAILNK